jgi:hypothetical protein
LRPGFLLKVIVAASLALVASIRLHAQYPLSPTIDLIVGEADQVVVGRILNTGSTTRDEEGRRRGTIVLAVEKTLKGDQVRGPLDLPIPNWDSWNPGGFYPATADPLPYADRLLVASLHAGAGPARIMAVDLDAASLAVMSADLVVLKNSAEVLVAVEDELRRLPARGKRIDFFEWPARADNVKGDPFYGYRVILPVDERLEKRAHAILHTESDEERPIAINALRFFKSDENVHLLMGALSDPDNSIRRYAYQVLKGWGVDAAEPVTHE